MEPQPIYQHAHPIEDTPLSHNTDTDSPEITHILNTTTQFSVRQRLAWNEIISGCEQDHVFDIAADSKELLFTASEKNTRCQRNCVPQENKAYNLSFADAGDRQFLHLKRDYACTFLCFNRKPIDVLYTKNGENIKLGTIKENWELFNFSYDICDGDGNLVFKVRGGCCQGGLVFPGLTAEKCSKAVFNVFKAGKQGEGPVTKITKQNVGFWKDDSGGDLNTTVQFARDETWENKLLLMAVLVVLETEVLAQKGGA